MAKVTVVLLNWKRSKQLHDKIIPSIASQTVKPKIYLWNNDDEKFHHPEVTWQIDSSRNKRCFPRWFMASMADTEFVCSLDDDVMFADNRVLEDMIAYYRKNADAHGRIAGSHGVILMPDKTYKRSAHVATDGKGDLRVDVVKGRFMFFRTALLNKVSFIADTTEDDIKLCSNIAERRRRYHVVPSFLHNRLRDLPELGVALCEVHGQAGTRNDAAKRFFDW